MRIARVGGWVVIHTPAKVNLFLEVLGRRADGFHEIETLMAAVDVRDTLEVRPLVSGKLVFSSRWGISAAQHDLGDVPSGEGNIIVRAAQRLRKRAGVLDGAEIRLTKRIASAAGLGGASSDAAATLVALNAAWQLDWSRNELAEVAAEVGSDVPFFLGSPVAICRGRGERIEPLESLPPLDLVIVRPPVGLSTPEVYKQCSVAQVPAHSELLIAAWKSYDYAALARQMINRLEPAAESLSPWIGRLRAAFARQGCWGHQMSGSGSSYFGLCRHAAHARQVARRIHGAGLGVVYCTRTVSGGGRKTGSAQAA